MNEFLLMLVILNPFSQLLYLQELMDELQPITFIKIHLKATFISLIIFLLFSLIGENYLMKYVFQIRLASLQIFGGIIMLFIAFQYIVKGPGSNLMFRGDITDLAPNISLPYMVGPGTLWISILIGKKYELHLAGLIIAGVLAVNFILIASYHQLNYKLGSSKNVRISKYLAILMRTNALFIGAIAVEMLISGIENVIN
ncbi:MAG: MarC family protein [Spirochaetia bacterium]|nr:MarC family protein [Spirochaetia bacterium]